MADRPDLTRRRDVNSGDSGAKETNLAKANSFDKSLKEGISASMRLLFPNRQGEDTSRSPLTPDKAQQILSVFREIRNQSVIDMRTVKTSKTGFSRYLTMGYWNTEKVSSALKRIEANNSHIQIIHTLLKNGDIQTMHALLEKGNEQAGNEQAALKFNGQAVLDSLGVDGIKKIRDESTARNEIDEIYGIYGIDEIRYMMSNINRKIEKFNKLLGESHQESSARDGEQSSNTGDGQNERKIRVKRGDDTLTQRSISAINKTLAKFVKFIPNDLRQKRLIDSLNTQVEFLNRNDVPRQHEGRYRQIRRYILNEDLRRLLGLPDFEGGTSGGDGGDDDAPGPDVPSRYARIRLFTLIESPQDSELDKEEAVKPSDLSQQDRVKVEQIEHKEGDTPDVKKLITIINKKLRVLNESGGIDSEIAQSISLTIDLIRNRDSNQREVYLPSVSRGLNSIESESTARDAIYKIYGMEEHMKKYTMDSANREIEDFNKRLGGSRQEASTRDGEQSSNTGDGQNVRRIQVRPMDDALTLSSISIVNQTLKILDGFTPNDLRQNRVIDFLNTQVEFLNRNDVPRQYEDRYGQVRKHILVNILRRLLDLDYNPDFEEARGGGDDDAPPPGPGPGGPTVKIRLYKPQEVQVESTTADNTTAGNTRVTNN